MPFFDNFAKKVGDAAKTAAKKSEEMVETTKLSMNINSQEDKIKKIYSEIGMAVYGKFKNGQSFDGDITGSCQQILEIEKDIESLKQKINKIKSIRVCPICKQELAQNAVFCPKCGAGISEAPAEQAPAVEAAEIIICQKCGAQVSEGVVFCQNCGNKL